MSDIFELLAWINEELKGQGMESQDSEYAFLVGIEMGIKMTLKELGILKG